MRSDHAREQRFRAAKPERRRVGTLFDEDEQADGDPAAAAVSTSGRPADRTKGDEANRSLKH